MRHERSAVGAPLSQIYSQIQGLGTCTCNPMAHGFGTVLVRHQYVFNSKIDTSFYTSIYLSLSFQYLSTLLWKFVLSYRFYTSFCFTLLNATAPLSNRPDSRASPSHLAGNAPRPWHWLRTTGFIWDDSQRSMLCSRTDDIPIR